MLTLIFGGAASGKSAYAEGLAAQGERPIYLATMVCSDGESRKRVERHRLQRSNLGFSTLECPVNLKGLTLSPGVSVLLECLSNLLANELYDPRGCGRDRAFAQILEGIETLCRQGRAVYVVSSEVFLDGQTYDPGTEAYLGILGELHTHLAALADCVVEVVCGIPIVYKGEANR